MVAVAGGVVAGSLISSQGAKSAASSASAAQVSSSNSAIAEQRRQYDKMQELLKPYIDAGLPALKKQQDYLGLNGNQAQQDFINQVSQSPELQSLTQQGENGILQNAAATGGLRGGNTQQALATLRPQLLQQLLQQKYAQFGGLTAMGQNSATGLGTQGIQTGQLNANQMNQIGAAQAGNSLAQGNANSGLGGAISGLAGMYGAYQMMNPQGIQQNGIAGYPIMNSNPITSNGGLF